MEGTVMEAAVVVGAATSSTGNGAPGGWSAVAVVEAEAPRLDDHRTNPAVVEVG